MTDLQTTVLLIFRNHFRNVLVNLEQKTMLLFDKHFKN